MKTTTYARVLERAKRLAHRTSTLPAEEASALRSYIAVELEAAWTSRWWPELAVMEEVAPESQLIDRRIGDEDEIGVVIGVYSADPRTAANWKLYSFSEHGEYVVTHTAAETVWIEYMPPPTDLDAVEDAALPGTLLPECFATALARKAAGYLLLGDGMTEAGNTMIARGQEDEHNLVLQLNFPRWWTRIVVSHCQ